MYCNYCGKVIQDDASHCAYCGKRIGSAVARRRLVRPRGDRKIAGVCAGFAEYFDLDVTLVRLVWLITAVMTGIGLLSYPIAWVVMPEEPLRARRLSATRLRFRNLGCGVGRPLLSDAFEFVFWVVFDLGCVYVFLHLQVKVKSVEGVSDHEPCRHNR